MARVTQGYFPRIAVIFDFDLTLAPGTVDALMDRVDIDPKDFRDGEAKLVDDGWDSSLALVWRLAEVSRSGKHITREMMAALGRELDPFAGVPQMFDDLREAARQVDEEIELNFHLLSSGLLDVIRHSPVAERFETVWGTTLHFDDEGAVAFPKRIVTHPEKERYLLALSKGMDPSGGDGPEDVYADVPREKRQVPLDQMIYVGDGRSDMPAFRLMNESGGVAIAIAKDPDDWDAADAVHDGRRVRNLAPPDFTPGSELLRSLELAVKGVACLTALERLGSGE